MKSIKEAVAGSSGITSFHNVIRSMKSEQIIGFTIIAKKLENPELLFNSIILISEQTKKTDFSAHSNQLHHNV